MKLDLGVRWYCPETDEELDSRLFSLLSLIEETGSLQDAARGAGISYRTAWKLIEVWNQRFAMPLCYKDRGRGTRLSELGEKLLHAKRRIDSGFTRQLKESTQALNEDMNKLANNITIKPLLKAWASHDLAINQFVSLCDKSEKLDVEFNSRGSLDALKQLYTGENHIAGFHFPEGILASELADEYMPLMDDERFVYIHLARRQQGLMLRPALKGHIKNITDLTRRSIRFINRQKGSGTRTVFDHLLALNKLKPRNINGYQREEFTHTAVAAMVSSSHADVGFGLKAAAKEFKLGFIPVLEESYIIAFHKSLPPTTQKEIRSLLKSPDLKQQIDKLPGYDSTLTGKLIHAHKLINTD